MAIPDQPNFALSDVLVEVGEPAASSLSNAFLNAVAGKFDATYVGSKDRLSNFRNYGSLEMSAESPSLVMEHVNVLISSSITKDGIWIGDESGEGSFMVLQEDKGHLQTYAMAQPYDFANLVFSAIINESDDDAGWRGVWMSPDGKQKFKVYNRGGNQQVIHDTWGTAWNGNTSTRTYQFNSPEPCTEITFNKDGTKFWLLGQSDTIFEYSMSSPWTPSTRTLQHTFTWNGLTYGTSPQTFWWDNYEERMFVAGVDTGEVMNFKASTTGTLVGASIVPEFQFPNFGSGFGSFNGAFQMPNTTQVVFISHQSRNLYVYDFAAV
jgi:hypothetical protein